MSGFSNLSCVKLNIWEVLHNLNPLLASYLSPSFFLIHSTFLASCLCLVFVFWFFSCSLIFSFHQTQTKAEQFCNTSILEWLNWSRQQLCQIAKYQIFFVNCSIQEIKFCKIAQLFLGVSFSGQIKLQRIERIIFTEKSSPNVPWGIIFSAYSMRYLLEQSGLFLPKMHEHWPVAVLQIPFPLQSFGQDKSGTEYRGTGSF